MKRLLSALLVGALCTGVLSGCGSNEKPSAGDSSDWPSRPITVIVPYGTITVIGREGQSLLSPALGFSFEPQPLNTPVQSAPTNKADNNRFIFLPPF